jgi:hypothetical protein
MRRGWDPMVDGTNGVGGRKEYQAMCGLIASLLDHGEGCALSTSPSPPELKTRNGRIGTPTRHWR